MKRSVLIIVAVAASLAGCRSYYKVQPASGVPGDARGVFYTLPRTVVTLTVPVVETTKEKGRYSEYYDFVGLLPEDLLLETDKKKEKKEENPNYSFGEIVIASRGEPDPDHVYFVDLQVGNGMTDLQFVAELSEHGLLSEGTAEVKDKTASIATSSVASVLGLAAKVAGTVLKFGGRGVATGEDKKFADRCNAITEEMEKKTTCWHAAQAASALKTVREKRLTLLADEAAGQPEAAATLDRRLKGLDTAEESILNLFRGTKTVKTWNATVETIPAAKSPHKITFVFDFAKKKVSEAGCPSATGQLGLEVTVTADAGSAEVADTVRKATEGTGPAGLHYRVPARAKLEAKQCGKESVTSKHLIVAQWGVVAKLPPGALSAEAKQVLSLYVDTGAMKKLDTQVRAGDPAAFLEPLNDSIGQVLEVVDIQRAPDEPTPLEDLEAERAVLEKQVAIEKLRLELEELQRQE